MTRIVVRVPGLRPVCNYYTPSFPKVPLRRRLVWSLLLVTTLIGCAAERQPAVPPSLTEQATVLGIPNARFWPDTQAAALAEEALQALARERASTSGAASGQQMASANFLAISGGSDDGAFGAGLLVGWTANGTRPQFKLVTGISTGSLIAPFAFLGPTYDPQLRALYTGIGPDDVFEKRGLLAVVLDESLADTSPLFRLISRYADARMLTAIADEYRKGRLLLIGTTDLDAKRPVLWNIGAIAASGRPEALQLVQKILLASAAVPGLFPPVLFNVEAGGRNHQELHVDGGAVAQTFLYPPQIGSMVNLKQGPLARERHAYIIRNSRLDPDWSPVDRKTLTIAGRAISAMIHYSGQNDVLRIYNTTRQDGVDYNLAFIDSDFNYPHKENFDTSYMRALFDYGYQRAAVGYRWHKAPPILVRPTEPRLSSR
jgi:Patatin-like phospholipase